MRGEVRGSKTKRATAYHEAGHAVMAWKERVRVNAASVIPEPGTLGRIHHANPLRGLNLEWDDSTRARIRVEKLVRICLAGRLAQQRACPGIRFGDEGDRKEAVNLLTYLCGSTEEVEAYWALLTVQTRRALALPHVWPLVEAVASALLRQGRLSGTEVLAVINNTMREELDRLRQKHGGSQTKRRKWTGVSATRCAADSA